MRGTSRGLQVWRVRRRIGRTWCQSRLRRGSLHAKMLRLWWGWSQVWLSGVGSGAGIHPGPIKALLKTKIAAMRRFWFLRKRKAGNIPPPKLPVLLRPRSLGQPKLLDLGLTTRRLPMPLRLATEWYSDHAVFKAPLWPFHRFAWPSVCLEAIAPKNFRGLRHGFFRLGRRQLGCHLPILYIKTFIMSRLGLGKKNSKTNDSKIILSDNKLDICSVYCHWL